MLVKAAIAAAIIFLASLGAAIAAGEKTDHDDKSGLPWCTGAKGEVENQNCKMPN
jgi:hypothetical protein